MLGQSKTGFSFPTNQLFCDLPATGIAEIVSRCFATQSRLQSENPSSSSRWLSRGFARRYNRMAQGGQMADIKRISVQQAYAKTKANQALLVCAYEDEAKCRMLNLDGSISFATLQSRAASLPKTQEIIFY